ncbi:M48 family metalloprotease [Flavobacterium chilense]|uniref:Peptidase family M48 n=1 Tax=Flavobacterium chilense TaxID=946677 RepID=A0A1M6ZWY7_9FLAO|nr:M48 family metalloprotease [Flavobacterium chilense]SHL34843.1 Peptidase family M48 [Flavobacterium chilense]
MNEFVESSNAKTNTEIKLENQRKIDWINMKIWYEKRAKKQGSGLIFQTVLFFLFLFAVPLITQKGIDNQRLIKGVEDRQWNQYSYQTNDDKQFVEDNYKRFMEDERDEGTSLPYMVVISILTIIQINIFLFTGIKNRLNDINYTKLTRDSFNGIWLTIDELASSMNIQSKSINIYYLHTNSFEAHVLKKDNKILLYLTRNIVSFYSQDKEKFKSIIAHELGHILQNDSRFMLVGLNLMIIPTLLVFIGGFLLLVSGTSLELFSSFGGIIFLTFFKFVTKRKESEFLADTASLCYLESTHILEVIEASEVTTAKFFYPTKNERVVYLNNVIKRFTL